MVTTTTSSIGATGRDFTDPQSWETSRGGDLVTGDRLEIGEMFNDATFTGITLFAGNTTDATRFMRLTVAAGERHPGKGDGSGVLIDPTSDGHAIELSTPFTEIIGLEIKDWTGNHNEGIFLNSTGLLVLDCIVHDGADSNAGGITSENRPMSAAVRNSIVYDTGRHGIGAHDDTGSGVGTIDIEHCAVRNCGLSTSGFGLGARSQASNATVRVTDSISMDQVNGSDYLNEDAASNFNLDSDNTAVGANSIHNKTASDQFVNITQGSEDYHLKSGADALDVGTTLAQVPTDIDGDARPQGSAVDMGADELLAVSRRIFVIT